MSDDAVVLDADADGLIVTGPDDVVDAVAAALAADKAALELVVEIFGPVTVVAAGVAQPWPPKGGFVPAWRRLLPRKPLIVLPSEHVVGRVAPYATEPPTTPCPVCAEREPKCYASSPTSSWETGPWQTCTRCGSRRWRWSAAGDECVACGPMPGTELPPATWVRAGTGWACSRCHPPVPPDPRAVCAICGGKGRCRPDHNDRLRAHAVRLLKKTKSEQRRRQIEAALAALP
jgi:hypothetical protein